MKAIRGDLFLLFFAVFAARLCPRLPLAPAAALPLGCQAVPSSCDNRPEDETNVVLVRAGRQPRLPWLRIQRRANMDGVVRFYLGSLSLLNFLLFRALLIQFQGTHPFR